MPITDMPVLEVYYADSCAPCRQELPVLVQAGEDTRLVIYVLDSAAHLQGLKDKAVITAPAKPRDVLRRAGDQDGILPYARSVTADGIRCDSWRGMLTPERIRILINACPSPVKPPP